MKGCDRPSPLTCLGENLGAANIVLGADDLAAIDAAVPETAVEGERYSATGMAMVNL